MRAKQITIVAFFLMFSFSFIHAQYNHIVSLWSNRGGAIMKQRTPTYYIELYNSDSLLVERRTHIVSNGSYDRLVFEYNQKKQKISETEYVFLNQLVVKRNFEYDEAGKLYSMTFLTRNKPGDKIQVKENYYYNDSGQLIKKIRSEKALDSFARFCCGDSDITTYEYKKISNGLIVTERLYYGGRKKAHRKITTYNEKGFVIREWSRDRENRFDYEYDDRGEWIKQKICWRLSKISPWICEEELRKTISPQ